MNESMTSELQTLRARAYGPDADLHRDAVALDRLRELEEIARGKSVGPADTSAQETEAEASRVEPAGGEAASAAPVDPEGAGPDSSESAVDPPVRRWSRKRLVFAFVASVATAVVVTAAATGAISRRVQADPREVAVLGIDPVAKVPQMFGQWECVGDECTASEEVMGTVYREFYGLSAFTLEGRFVSGREDTSCLMIIESSQMEREPNSFTGQMYHGCGAGEFPATVQVPVTADLPEKLRAEFPDGSGLQFVLQGSEVIVLSDVR